MSVHTSTPAVSVALPVYNAERYLGTAVASILGQTFRDFELITVDDGSTDASLAILRDFERRDSRVRVISRPNTGIVGALNDAWRGARGLFVARMDADDISFPDRFARQVAFLLDHPEVVCLGASVVYIDADGDPVQPCPRALDHSSLESALLEGDGGSLIHPAIMIRQRALAAIGGYRPDVQYVEDLDLFLRLARVGQLANLAAPLLFYRVHPTSINFTRNAGRRQTKLRVLADAHRERSLPFDPAAVPLPAHDWADVAAHHREWAVTALQYGRRRVALRHALSACRLEPTLRDSWRCLSYALRAPKPATASTLPSPTWFLHPISSA